MQRAWADARRHPDGFVDWRQQLVQHARGRTVLDIGFVEHDESYMASQDWEHGLVASVAKRCVGVDLLEEGVAAARKRGLEAVAMDATSEETLDDRFDLVIIGDVIEHVHSPEGLLRFAARHLGEGGQILLKTPNPHWLIFLLKCLVSGSVIANADHVGWFTPDNFRELASRTDLEVEWFAGSRGPARRAWVDAIKQQRLFLRDNALTWQSIVVRLVPASS